MTDSHEPRTEAGRSFDHEWPGSHLDRLQWRERILAIEAEARAEAAPEREGLDVERLRLMFHEQNERDQYRCTHPNQYRTAWECQKEAVEFAAEYARLAPTSPSSKETDR